MWWRWGGRNCQGDRDRGRRGSGGDVLVASTGVIEGNAISVGGDVEKEPGATVRGERSVVSFLPKIYSPSLPFLVPFKDWLFLQE